MLTLTRPQSDEHRRLSVRSILGAAILVVAVHAALNAQARIRVPLEYDTIQEAITAAYPGDTVSVAPGTYPEALTIDKKIVLVGDDTTVVVTPLSGNGLTITADTVTIRTIKFAGGLLSGITATGRKAIVLDRVVCRGHTGSGASFGTSQGLTITGGAYSDNLDEGINLIGGSAVTMTNVTASGNGTAGDGSGINLSGVAGPSTITNATTRLNRRHGLSISNGSSGVTISGGTYSRNGTSRGSNGGGISVNAETGNVQNVVLQGTVVADSNATAGVWVSAGASSFQAANISIAQSGALTVRRNGGSGVIFYGNVATASVTGTFVKGATSNASGVMVVGTSTTGTNSPTGISITGCHFSGGYKRDMPAITLSSGSGQKCSTTVTADANTFQDAIIADSIESLVYHKPDDAVLGTVVLTNSSWLPVELTSFSAVVQGSIVRLSWTTATETQNYGFEIERREASSRYEVGSSQTEASSWVKVGFVAGAGTSSSPREYQFVDDCRSTIVDLRLTGYPSRFEYRLIQLDFDGTVSYPASTTVEVGGTITEGQRLDVFPNPFNPETTVEWTSEQGGHTSVRVYAIDGELVAEVWGGHAEAGRTYVVPFRPQGLASGTYFLRLESPAGLLTRKLLILR